MCISDGKLRAKIDGGLGETELAGVNAHLEQCGRCRERAAALAERAGRVDALFSALAPEADAVPVDAAAAFARLDRERTATATGRSGLRRLFAPRLTPAWGAAAVIGLIGVLMVSAPARAVAQKLLGMLRIKAVVAVPMERDVIAEGKGEMLQQLLADSVVKTKESRRVVVADRAEAGRVAGLNVRLPELRTDSPQLAVNTEGAFHFDANEQRLQTLLSVAGRTDLDIPAQLNGAKVFVDVPAGVVARYGNCPDEHVRWAPDGVADCVIVTQVPAPTVVTLPELDLQSIAEFGLQLSGMSADQAHTFAQTVDWTSTIAIPIPRNAANYETVDVDGVKGLLVAGLAESRRNLPPAYGLVWVKNGVIYSVGGFGNASLALPLAQSLR
jgi:anti-sigma factor RsiW